jgi:DNA topoisomerase-1
MTSKYTLLIAEKPDAARRISEAIADTKPETIKKRGVAYYAFTVQGKRHICVPAVGHLFILTPSKDKNPTGWNYPVFNLEWIPTYTKKATAWTYKYFQNIHDLSQDASDFIDAADVDMEGEVLLFNILRFICNVKNAKRMKFSTLTRDELRESYQKMSPTILHSTLERGLTRHELDALWGLNLTRALTLALQKQVNRGFTILSTGRVQGPTLAILPILAIKVKS